MARAGGRGSVDVSVMDTEDVEGMSVQKEVTDESEASMWGVRQLWWAVWREALWWCRWW